MYSTWAFFACEVAAVVDADDLSPERAPVEPVDVNPAPAPARSKIARSGNLQPRHYDILDILPQNALPSSKPRGQHQFSLSYPCRMSVTVDLKARLFRVKCRDWDWEETRDFRFDLDGGIGYAWGMVEAQVKRWHVEWRSPKAVQWRAAAAVPLAGLARARNHRPEAGGEALLEALDDAMDGV